MIVVSHRAILFRTPDGMTETSEKDVGFFQRIIGDGRPASYRNCDGVAFRWWVCHLSGRCG
jgi:hypothetical protein